MTPNQSYKGAHYSAILKEMYRRARLARADRYKSRTGKEQWKGENGLVIVKDVTIAPDATPMTPRERHKFAMKRPDRYYF